MRNCVHRGEFHRFTLSFALYERDVDYIETVTNVSNTRVGPVPGAVKKILKDSIPVMKSTR